jgi:VIT1/CCC1 family predicted Fe2+/Mn2+ transporter
MNRIRAAVLGANDGIVSTAAITVGVAGATSSTHTIVLAGLAAIVGGAISMGLGEYVSVASQRDSEEELVTRHQLTADSLVSPWHAAIASAASFTAGAVLPLAAAVLAPSDARIPVTFAVVIAALALTGATAARIGGSPIGRATLRVVIGGVLALAATYAVGTLLNQQ